MHYFEFEYPIIFLLLSLIVCFYKCPYVPQKIYFPHLAYFSRFSRWINREKLLYALIFSLGITALASPISYDAKLQNKRKGRDLVFVLDTSGSMGESRFSKESPQISKFSLLIQTIRNFITHRYDDNVGVSVFGSYAFASIPLTYDMHAVSFLLDFIDIGIAGENTAIGDGLFQAYRLLKQGNAKKKVIILVTDGYQNSGKISIKKAISLLQKHHIIVYTIGVGEKGSYDEKLLKKIAQDTSGKMFKAENERTLQEIYNTLNNLQPSHIKSQSYLHKHLLYPYPLIIMFLLLFFLLYKKRSTIVIT